ncbi:MAG: hypothetical protein Q8R82_07045 [Hyphomonadaceae bacterium]|nr:hypothetical protein [Hyphomonadaceae bacterium]
MNAILLGAASLGALVSIFTADTGQIEAAQRGEDVGAMERTTLVDTGTGEITQLSVISFID